MFWSTWPELTKIQKTWWPRGKSEGEHAEPFIWLNMYAHINTHTNTNHYNRASTTKPKPHPLGAWGAWGGQGRKQRQVALKGTAAWNKRIFLGVMLIISLTMKSIKNSTHFTGGSKHAFYNARFSFEVIIKYLYNFLTKYLLHYSYCLCFAESLVFAQRTWN